MNEQTKNWNETFYRFRHQMTTWRSRPSVVSRIVFLSKYFRKIISNIREVTVRPPPVKKIKIFDPKLIQIAFLERLTKGIDFSRR